MLLKVSNVAETPDIIWSRCFIHLYPQTTINEQYLRLVNCLCAGYFTLERAFWQRVPSLDGNCPLNMQFITSRWRLTDSLYHAATYGEAHVLTLVLQSYNSPQEMQCNQLNKNTLYINTVPF